MSSTQEWVAGIHGVTALFQQSPERIKRLQIAQDSHDPRVLALAAQAEQMGLSIERVRVSRLDRHTEGVRHQGIIAWTLPRAKRAEVDLLTEVAPRTDLILALDRITDPHNLGACLRTAAAAAAGAVLIPRDHSVGLTPAAVRVASGGAEAVPLIPVANLARTLGDLKGQGFWIVGLAGEAAVPVFHHDLTVPTVLVLGAEGEGLRHLTRERCDVLVSIPMPGPMASLNVSVATGIALFEAVRQRAP